MRVLLEVTLRGRADALRWGVAGAERRVIALERLELPEQRVVFPVGDRRTIENVVLVVRALDRFPQRVGASRERGIDGQWGASRTLSLGLFADHLHGDGHQALELLVRRLRQKRLGPQMLLGLGIALEQTSQESQHGNALQVGGALRLRDIVLRAHERLEAVRIAQRLAGQRRDHLAEADVALGERVAIAFGAQKDGADHGALRLDRHDDDRADVARVEVTLHIAHHRVNGRVGNEHRLARFEGALQLRIAVQVDDQVPDGGILVAGDEPDLGVVAGEEDRGAVEAERLAQLARDGLQDVDEVQRRRDFLQDVDGRDQMVALTLKLGYPRFQTGYLGRLPWGLLALGEHDRLGCLRPSWCAP